MDNQLEEKNEMEKDLIIVSQFIKSTNEDREYFIRFNEYLFQDYNKWYDDFKMKIQKGIGNSVKNINISDFNNSK